MKTCHGENHAWKTTKDGIVKSDDRCLCGQRRFKEDVFVSYPPVFNPFFYAIPVHAHCFCRNGYCCQCSERQHQYWITYTTTGTFIPTTGIANNTGNNILDISYTNNTVGLSSSSL